MKIQDWLRLFRSQTAPATILLILVPYLTNASLFSLEALVIGLFALFTHWISFGMNSLMDTAMGYDLRDKSKAHHPLVTGRISMAAAHNVIHWGLCGSAVIAILLSFYLAPNTVPALISIFLWFVFGHAYNSGLSKESLLSFLPISICFASMGMWGWFLSHNSLNRLGWLLLAYFFMTILFQISWSGHLKELELKERSNILVKMGAKIENGRFTPGFAFVYGWVVKWMGIPVIGSLILWENFNVYTLSWFVLMTFFALKYLVKLTIPRTYIRENELKNMSMMEVLTIFLPTPLVLPWLEATILMAFGITYFLVANRLLWGVASHPRV